jgi:hypothetical protein
VAAKIPELRTSLLGESEWNSFTQWFCASDLRMRKECWLLILQGFGGSQSRCRPAGKSARYPIPTFQLVIKQRSRCSIITDNMHTLKENMCGYKVASPYLFKLTRHDFKIMNSAEMSDVFS